ncbi:MAG: type II toxin-antitoxin system VapC family toxin [Myxococcales bacterium]|nr:type II toxin-antitoxin system VapC family toxin [Myxococcales bacterium]
MRFVLDNSVLVAWAFDEESDYANAVGASLAQHQALVPAVWPLEFANTLLVAERRGRLTETSARQLRDHMLGLGIVVVPDHPPRVLTDVLALARLHGLTAYDASYLDLAMREGVPLATLDSRLAEAARRAGVPNVGS